MTIRGKKYDSANKDQVFYTLRREILAARLKVTLDEQLKRETSSAVKRLAQMKLPPAVTPQQAEVAQTSSQQHRAAH